MAEKQPIEEFKTDKLNIISVKLPKEQIKELSELSRSHKYANRSEIIRLAIRDLIKQIDGKY
jgi:Arc/MetJ-type ribon-helix-helix transcriptional regulator